MKDESKPNTPESAQETSSEQKESQSLKELLSQMDELPFLPRDSDSGATQPRYGGSILDLLKQTEHLTPEQLEYRMQMYDAQN
jgi:hypothetical protein